MKKQEHIRGTLLSKLEEGKPALVKLEDNSIMRTSSVIRYVGDAELVWFETQNTWYCLKFTEKRSLNRHTEKAASQGTVLGPFTNAAMPYGVEAV